MRSGGALEVSRYMATEAPHFDAQMPGDAQGHGWAASGGYWWAVGNHRGAQLVGGFTARHVELVRLERLRLGASLSAGLLFASPGLPVSLQLGERTWLYAVPTYRFQRVTAPDYLPLGVARDLKSGRQLTGEVGASGLLGAYELARFHAAVGVSRPSQTSSAHRYQEASQ